MAGSNVFTINVTGKGGHAAMPNFSIDPVLVATHLVQALQSIITLTYYALTAGVAALLLYNFVKARSWEREVLYLIVLVPFLLRVFHLK